MFHLSIPKTAIATIITSIVLVINIPANTALLYEDAFYELLEDNLCTGVAVGTQQVNLLCSMDLDLISECKNATTAKIRWTFSSTSLYQSAINEDSKYEKYGIWNETKESVLSSVLRIKDLKDKDAGIYTCSLTCHTSKPIATHQLELCVKDSATSLTECSQATSEDSCAYLFSNGICNENCNSENQLFDGGDCDVYRLDTCPVYLLEECHEGFEDGVCDSNCSISECGFDGGDCLNEVQSINRETMGVIVPLSLSESDIRALTYQLSVSLSTLVKIHGPKTVWEPSNSGSILITYLNANVFQTSGANLVMLNYKLVPQSCGGDKRCFHRVTNAAKYISHHLNQNASYISSAIAAIGVNSQVDACPERKEEPSPSVRHNIGINPGYINPNTTKKENTTSSLDDWMIGLIVVTIIIVVLLLVLGVYCTFRYRRIGKARKKELAEKKKSDVKAYIETIPDYHGSPSSKSVTSNVPNLNSSRLPVYKTDEDCQV